jgi:hypothetical protein
MSSPDVEAVIRPALAIRGADHSLGECSGLS